MSHIDVTDSDLRNLGVPPRAKSANLPVDVDGDGMEWTSSWGVVPFLLRVGSLSRCRESYHHP